MSERWVGIFEVLERPGGAYLKGRPSAFVNVVGLGDSEAIFVQKVKEALAEYGFVVIGVEKVALVGGRIEQNKLSRDLVALVEQIDQKSPILFGDFYSFDDSESE